MSQDVARKKKLLVLTSGGDAPGMNAALRAVVRSGHYYGLEVFACRLGFRGLIEEDIIPLQPKSVANIIQRGGTILKTARCQEFFDPLVRKRCGEFLAKQDIHQLIVIGGDGSFRGATLLHQETGCQVIGIPATIDNDITGTDYTIGFDTASNTALLAIDKIRDTASSHERCFLIEVMGRHSGFLALNVGIAGGAEMILIPEYPVSIEQIVAKVTSPRRAKQSNIFIIAEGEKQSGKSIQIAEQLKELTSLSFRVCILGHTQRGGSPTVLDRNIASAMGELAVKSLVNGKTSLMTSMQDGKITLAPFPKASDKGRRLTDQALLELAKILAI